MHDIISTGLLVLALGLFGLALLTLAGELYAVSGISFLSASVVLYLRETR